MPEVEGFLFSVSFLFLTCFNVFCIQCLCLVGRYLPTEALLATPDYWAEAETCAFRTHLWTVCTFLKRERLWGLVECQSATWLWLCPCILQIFLFPSCYLFYIGGMLVYVRLYVCVHTWIKVLRQNLLSTMWCLWIIGVLLGGPCGDFDQGWRCVGEEEEE